MSPGPAGPAPAAAGPPGAAGRSALVRNAVEEAHRREWALVLAAAARTASGDLHLAEESTQDAFVAALETWGDRGIPARPGAWLTRTAQRRVLDRLRRDTTLRRKLPVLLEPAIEEADEEAPVLDDRLRLVFTCCHPALALENRVALTLRMVGGLTTAEIARAFLVSEPTMAARITRAKKKIAVARIPYAVPSGADLPDRLDGALAVIHLVFTTGHTAPDATDLVRPDLVGRALDLARVLAVLMPDESEALALLSLLLLTDSRRAARSDSHGDLVLLADQDRTRWDRAEIARGLDLLARAGRLAGPRRPAGRYVLQAGIAAVHAEAPTWESTDWTSLVALYDRLLRTWPSPVVALNRAVAVGMAAGPEAGLAALDEIADDPALLGYHYLPAARADLLRRLHRDAEAAAAYRRALATASNRAERAFLQRRLAEVDPGHDPAT